MYKEYTARPETRLFLVLHPNIVLSVYVKKRGAFALNAYVKEGAFAFFIQISASVFPLSS